MKGYLILKDVSKHILFLGVSMKTKGGMTSVLVSYNKYIENMRFIPTWRLGNGWVKGWYAFQALLRAWWLCKFDKDIRIVHIHGAANASFYRCRMFIRLAKKCNKKVILHEHAADFVDFYNTSNNKDLVVGTINNCDCFIVLSESWRNFFVSIGVDEDKIRVVHNIVARPEETKVLQHDDKKLHLMYLGEISNRKGAFDLLKAMADNKDYFRDRLLLRMGGNEVNGDIRTFIKKNGLDGFVTYEGWVSGQKKLDCLIWEDVYILPSYNEGLPIAILEAMSYGHPIISTPVGGIPEVVSTLENGILVRPGDIAGISKAVKFYVEDKDAIKRHGVNSLRKVASYFPECVFSQLKDIYIKMQTDDFQRM